MSAIQELLSEVVRQREAVCDALRPGYPEPMDIFIGTGGFHERIDQLHIAAPQEAEGRGLAAYLAPLIDELVHAHHVLFHDAIAVWNLFDDADAGLVKKPNRA